MAQDLVEQLGRNEPQQAPFRFYVFILKRTCTALSRAQRVVAIVAGAA
ncbi:hypothetical protein KCP74_16620 [Salmonella enterica subsp. enterica]|nr:hypothetical protein KCP74_16620 [Salmonella enterica subsp. enterica]